MSKFIKFCRAMFHHLAPLTSLGSYLATLQAVHLQPNPWIILKCRLLLLLYACVILHFLSLATLSLSPIDRLLLYDILYLIIPERAINLFACAFVYLGGYAYSHVHFNVHLFRIIYLLECLLNQSACRFFLCKRNASCATIQRLYWQFGVAFRCLKIASGKQRL